MRILFQACRGAAVAGVLVSESLALADGEAPSSVIERLAEDWHTLATQYETAPLALSYIDNLKNLGDEQSLIAAGEAFSTFEKRLAVVDETALNTCDRLDLDRMRHMTAIAASRAALGAEFRSGDDDIPNTGIADVRNGKAWYRHFLHAWLGEAVDPNALFRTGMEELAAANRRYETLSASMEARNTQTAETAQDQYTDENAIRVAYEERWAIVSENLGRLFRDDYGVAPVIIARSPLGDALPAAGYYVSDEQTFYYNVFQDGYDLSQIDWVFLHEALPGHHFAIQAARLNNPCKNRLPDLSMYAYIEGWGAYVETLGKPLGLYREDHYELSALEWDMVRSARVALDVGMNYHGWTDEEALDFWKQEVSGAEHFARREIDRMRRWPAQAVTYKYGAAVFTRMRERLKTEHGDRFDIRDYHDVALRYGDMPLSSFEALVRERFAEKAQSSDGRSRLGENP